MGVKQLREAFDAAAGAGYACSLATMHLERADNAEWQVLTFSGTAPDGSVFTTQSARLGPSTNLEAAARATAESFVNARAAAPAGGTPS